MGANDDILAEGDGKVADKPAVDQAAIAATVKSEITQFESQFGQRLDKFGTQIGEYVQNALKAAQNPTKAELRDPNSTAQKLLNDPEKTVKELVNEWAQEHLAPHLATQVNDKYEDLLDRQRTNIDKRWGEGAFDSIVRPEVEAAVESTPNKAARASQQYISAAVSGTVGREAILDKLLAHKAEHEKKAKEREAADVDGSVLDAGRPRRRTPAGELDDDSKRFLEMHSKVTGVEHNHKRLAEIMRVRNTAGFIDTQNMPGAKNKLPVKGARHRPGVGA